MSWSRPGKIESRLLERCSPHTADHAPHSEWPELGLDHDTHNSDVMAATSTRLYIVTTADTRVYLHW